MSGKARLSEGLKNLVAVREFREHLQIHQCGELASAEYAEIALEKLVEGFGIIGNK